MASIVGNGAIGGQANSISNIGNLAANTQIGSSNIVGNGATAQSNSIVGAGNGAAAQSFQFGIASNGAKETQGNSVDFVGNTGVNVQQIVGGVVGNVVGK
ncbi:hypothetical protein HDU96_002551 [Phlyctochytrium bullatum]|nr:hypothetical protein HDU96_002551 [Phlyctochytrium bullatum]